ncbi:MAG: alpha/beta hydrolase [Anaerolineae bacterium]|nr:alpha/beta hydrolase [Anaerolineae bacterium]
MRHSESRFHPQLRQFARFMPGLRLNQFKASLINRALPLLFHPKPPQDILIHDAFLARKGTRSKLRLRIYKPAANVAPSPALVWFHGGGYVIGVAEMDDLRCAEFSRRLGITVISVDYRLAPQHPFPAALEDGWAALNWVFSESEVLGIDPQRIAIGGGSAGGGLAAALAQYALDQNHHIPAFQLLVYPMLDDRTVTRLSEDKKDFILWPRKSNRFGWESYLGRPCGEPTVPAYAVPARRENLSGLPPAWIGVGSEDMFHAEDIAYARNLSESGVKCELVVVPGAFHGFDTIDPKIPVAREFRESQISALREHLNIS